MAATADAGQTIGTRWTMPALIGLIVMGQVGFGVVIPLLPFYASAFKAPAWQVMIMFSAFSLGQFAGELTWGRLSDRLGRRRVLLITLVGSAAGYIALAEAPTIAFAILARGVIGVFSGNLSTIQGYVIDITPRSRIASRLGMTGSAMAMGVVVGPIIGGVLADPSIGAAGFRLPLLVSAGLCLIAFLAGLKFLREHKKASSGLPIGPIEAIHLALSAPLLPRLLLITMAGMISFSAMWSSVGLWGKANFGWSSGQIGMIIALVGVSASLCQATIAAIAIRRAGEAMTLLGGLALASASFLFQGLAPSSIPAVAGLLMAVGGQGITQSAMSSLISHLAPSGREGATMAANTATASLARVIGPLVAGVLYTTADSVAPIYFASAGMMLGAVLTWRVRQDAEERIAQNAATHPLPIEAAVPPIPEG